MSTTVQATTPIIDVDSHVLEPPDLFLKRLPKKWLDDAPTTVLDERTGTERWIVAGKSAMGAGTYAAAEWNGFWPSRPPRFEDAAPGSWDPAARLEWMDRCGVQAQVLYPNLLGFHVWAFLQLDEDLRLACVRAYNDFQAEFASAAPDRLIPLDYLPWWDLDESIKEVERCVEIGHKGINLGFEFEKLGYPRLRDPHWEPLLRCIETAGLSVNFHVGFNSQSEQDNTAITDLQDTLDIAKASTLFFLGNISCVAELIMGRICQRFPDLKFVSVESGFGYIPYLLEALDWQFVNMGGQVTYPDFLLPSEYFTRQIYATFWFERHLVGSIDLYADNLMFETDYPHGTSLSPGKNSFAKPARQTVEENLAGVPDEIVRKVIYANAAKVYGLPALPGSGASPSGGR